MPKAKTELLATAELVENKVLIWKEKEWKKVYEEKYFGKVIEEGRNNSLQLSLAEAMLLFEKGILAIKEKGKKISTKKFYEKCVGIDPEFPQKYTVYRDLRNRGYIVKSGFKFGTHFRVYERGVNPYKGGSKGAKEHTKYNVHAVPENVGWSLAEWSRYVRLSQNIRATALLAVVDEESGITYYKIQRVKI